LQGVVAGVPFVALGPHDERPDAPVILAWHSIESPGSEAEMAAALPMATLPAWRVYLGVPLPYHARPEGLGDGRGGEDDLLRSVGRSVVQAADELPAALRALGEHLPVSGGSLGLLGSSIGATVAQLLVTETDLEIAALALVSPVIQLRSLVDVPATAADGAAPAGESSPSIADRLDFLARIRPLCERRPPPPVLVVVGAEDQHRFVDPAMRLWAALSMRGAADRSALVTVPGMGHAVGGDLGLDAAVARQSAQALHVDRVLTAWFRRQLGA
jgi:pimeloyl-ACP methyl ester carboxylesterase